MAESCNVCTFFKGKQGPGKEGRCKRFPHAIDKSPNDWCGEHVRDTRLIRIHKAVADPVPCTEEELNDG